MENTTQPQQRHYLITALWGLLLTKCFSLEYLVVNYSVPINSTVFIWAPSIFMAAVATVVSINLKTFQWPRSISVDRLIWAVGFVTVVAISLSRQTSEVAPLPLIAVIVGTCYISQGLLLKYPLVGALGLCWWIGAAALWRTDAPTNFLVFAVCVFFLTTMPLFIQYFKLRNRCTTLAH